MQIHRKYPFENVRRYQNDLLSCVVLHGFMLIHWYCTYAKLTRNQNPKLFRMKSYNFNDGQIADEDEDNNIVYPQLDNLEKSITETEEGIIINKKKICYGVLLVIGIGISWASSTQFAQHVQIRSNVKIPPFALMWFATTFKIFCAIPVIIAHCKQKKNEYVEMITPQSIRGNTPRFYRKVTKNKTKHKPIAEIFNAEEYDIDNNHDQSHQSQYGTTISSDGASIASNKSLNKRTLSDAFEMTKKCTSTNKDEIDLTPNNWTMCGLYLLFYALWTGANYCYYRALDSNSATIVTALFSSNNMFIYVLSIFILKEIFSWLRMFAVITAILGILFIALNNKNSKIALFGSILALMSSIFAAFYKVYFKKIFGDMNVMNVCKFLGYIGLFNGAFMWIVILILHVTNIERLPTENINEWPWGFLVGTALCGLAFDFLINFGIAFTYPLFIALGIIIGIPFNLTADIMINKVGIGAFETIGVLCICGGFLIIVLTDLHGKGTNASFRK